MSVRGSYTQPIAGGCVPMCVFVCDDFNCICKAKHIIHNAWGPQLEYMARLQFNCRVVVLRRITAVKDMDKRNHTGNAPSIIISDTRVQLHHPRLDTD